MNIVKLNVVKEVKVDGRNNNTGRPVNKKSIMRYIINGIVDIVKLIIVLYAMWFAWDTGIISDVINYFSK